MRAPVAAVIPVSSESWLHERYETVDVGAVVRIIRAEKRTGSLTIHFNSGGIGDLEWRQKKPHPIGESLPIGDGGT